MVSRKSLVIGFLIFSVMPIWRTGTKKYINLWAYLFNHTVFRSDESIWIHEKHLKVIKALAEEGYGQ